jgi:hypothetical protein
MPITTFLLMAKNWRIQELNKTEEGRQYLQEVEDLKNTEVDLEAIRKDFRKG